MCFATAQVFTAGYDLATPPVADTLATFDEVVGRHHLVAIHCNDSKHACGATRTTTRTSVRAIGTAGIRAFLIQNAIQGLPVVCETPTEDGRRLPWNIQWAHELAGIGS